MRSLVQVEICKKLLQIRYKGETIYDLSYVGALKVLHHKHDFIIFNFQCCKRKIYTEKYRMFVKIHKCFVISVISL